MEKFDLVVIGAGPGGYPAAIRGAQLGAKVAIVEKECLGGTCLNWGCIPTKALIASSDLYHQMTTCDDMGIMSDGVSFDYGVMVERKNNVVKTLQNGIGALLKANKVTVFTGTASFRSRNRIAVTAEDGTVTDLETSNTIIATGSTSAMPGFIPEHKLIVESRAFLDMTDLPKSMIVLGGGVIGCEFACMAAQLGCKVTVVELLDDILMMADADVRGTVREYMENELGIKVMTGKALENIKGAAKTVSGTVDGKKVSAAMLLVAIGRSPVTDGLGLANAGIETDERGYIPVDETCLTSAATIYAIGDVNGGPQLAHAATAQGVTAAENAVLGTRKNIETLVPACIFTAPEVGGTGLTEQDAKEKGIDVKVGKFAFASLGKALASGHATGFVKWVVDAKTDQLLGAHSVGPHATELISEATAAIQAELTAAELGKTVHAHPTLSEVWMEAAHAVHGECIHAAPKRKK